MKEMTDSPSSDRKSPGNRHRRSRGSGQNIRTAILYGLIGLAVIVVVVFLNLQSEQRKKKIRDENMIAEIESAETSFDQQLARGNINQLIELSHELANAADETVVLRLDGIRKQIAICDRILELEPDTHSRTHAISTKLTQLMDRAEIIAREEMYSVTPSSELMEFADEHANSDETSVASPARTGIAIASISEFLSAGPSPQRGGLANEAIEALKTAAEFSSDDPAIANRLHDWLQIVRKQCKPEESRLFFNAWSDVYSHSSDSHIASLVDQIGNASDFSEVELVDISDSVLSNRDDVVRQLLDQIDVAFNRTDVSNATVQFALQRATQLLAFGRVDDAKTIRQKLEQSAIGSASDQIHRELTKFDRRLNLFDSPFDVSSFTDVNSNPVKFSLGEAKFRILYFISDLNNGESMPRFTRLIETVRNELLNSSLEIVVIYLDQGNDSETLEQIRILAAQNFRWQVWLLTTSTAAGQKFLDRLPIEKSPYVVILDNDNRTIALDPSVFQIEEIVFAVRTNANK